jgi:hypothetical protein
MLHLGIPCVVYRPTQAYPVTRFNYHFLTSVCFCSATPISLDHVSSLDPTSSVITVCSFLASSHPYFPGLYLWSGSPVPYVCLPLYSYTSVLFRVTTPLALHVTSLALQFHYSLLLFTIHNLYILLPRYSHFPGLHF